LYQGLTDLIENLTSILGSGTTSAVIKEGGSLPRLPTFISFGNGITLAVGGGPSTTNIGGDKSGG
jgi:hypothetical protein